MSHASSDQGSASASLLHEQEVALNKEPFLVRNAGSIVLGLSVLGALYVTSLHSYLLFHSLVELFTIIVAGGIFVIAWNSRGYMSNNYLLFIAIASVFVALVDLIHTLAYEGMGVFPNDTANLATQLWIAGRYLQSLSWLIAPLFLGRKLKAGFQFAAYFVVTAFLLLSIFYWQVFPAAFVPGIGLTAFKKTSEYVISLIFLASIALLLVNRGEFDRRVRRLVILSLAFSIAAEIAFTSYISVYGGANLVGHLLRWIAFYLLYKAIIETGFVQPYALLLRDIKRSDDQSRDYAAALQAQNVELVRTENQLRADGAVLKARNEELDAFAHTVAHDLKHPLSVIITAADVINEVTDLSHAEQREFLQQIKSTAFEMNEIIESLMLLSEVRKVEAPADRVDMADVVQKVHRRLNYLIKEYRGRLVSPKSWPAAIGYAPWVEEVWANYISNALKYGGPSPSVELGADPECNGMVRFWTRDRGGGVSPEAQASIFTPFTQLRQRKRGGHGLGLSIVLRIIQKLGGQVGVESADGQGSLFYFTLPAAHAPDLGESQVLGTSTDPSRQPALNPN